jgi:hypothetical protein
MKPNSELSHESRISYALLELEMNLYIKVQVWEPNIIAANKTEGGGAQRAITIFVL